MFPILYEDNHLIVVNKPAGWVVQGAQENDRSVIKEVAAYIKHKYQKPGNVFVGVVSRLDRPVTGVLPLARTSKGAARLSEQFRNREVQKIYWALLDIKNVPLESIFEKVPVTNRIELRSELPLEGSSHHLKHWLLRNERAAKTMFCDHEVPGASLGVLSFRTISRTDSIALVEIELETGRKHQIRAQMEAIGCPILGDQKYGSTVSWGDSIALHCRSISLKHPTKEELLTWETSPLQIWNRYMANDLGRSS